MGTLGLAHDWDSIEGERSALGDIIIMWALNWVMGKRTHEGDG